MNADNPLLKHPVDEIYEGIALQAALAIRESNIKQLESSMNQHPEIAKDRGFKNLPLLVWSMGHGNTEAFRVLLKAGAPPNDYFLVNEQRMSLLSLATGAESEEYFELLLSNKANPDGLPGTEPPLFTAFYTHKDDRFERLLQAGANINASVETGQTVIMTVALSRNYRRALRLAQQGADLNAEMSNGTNLRKIIEKFPLPPDSVQGQAQRQLKALIK